MLGLLKWIREQIGKGPGDTIEVTIQKDEEARVVEIPPAFEKLLKKEGCAGVRKAELHPSQGILPLANRGQTRRDPIGALGKSDSHAQEGNQDSRLGELIAVA